MNRIKKAYLHILLLAGAFFGIMQDIAAQPCFYDSLRQALTFFHTIAYDENLKKAINRAQILAQKDTISNALAQQLELLFTNDMLFCENRIPSRKVQQFSSFLIRVLQRLQPVNASDSAVLIDGLGQVKLFMYNLNEALLLFKKSAVIKARLYGKESLPYGVSLFYMGLMYDRKYKGAPIPDSMYRQALAIITRVAGKENEWFAQIMETRSRFYLNQLDYKCAHRYEDTAVAVWKRILDKNNPEYIRRVHDAAEMYGYLYDYATSLSLHQEAVTAAKQILGEHHLQYAQCIDDLACTYYSIGYYEKAIPFYEQELAIKQTVFGTDCGDLVLPLHNLATTYVQMGEYEQALPLFEKIIAIQEKTLKTEDHLDYYAYELNWQAYLYQLTGNYDKAFSLYTQALQITKQTIGEQTLRYTVILKNLANLYKATGNYPQAIAYLHKVLSLNKKVTGEETPEYATALSSLATLYKEINNIDSALLLFKKALAIRKNKALTSQPDYATALNNLGEVYMQQGIYDSAFCLFNQALAIRKKVVGELHPDYIASLTDLALLKMQAGNITGAASLLVQANNLELKHIANAYTSLSEEEKLALVNKEFYQFSYIPSLLMNAHITRCDITQQIYSNELSLKGMVLNNQRSILNAIRASRDEQTLQLYNQWRSNKNIIGKELLLPIKQRTTSFDSLQQSTNELEQELSRQSATFSNYRYAQPVTTAAISQKLATGEACVEFTKFKLYHTKWTDSIMYAALVLLPGDSIPRFIPLCEEKSLLRLVKLCENSIQKAPYSSTNKKQSCTISDSLYALIWKPLESYLVGVHTITYAPVGLLNRIALAALPYDREHFLVDKYRLNQLLSTRAVSPARADMKPADLNIWGNIQYDYTTTSTAKATDYLVKKRDTITAFSVFDTYLKERGTAIIKIWNELPGTRQEIDSIDAVCKEAKLNITVVSDTSATEEAFKAMDGKSPQVIHIATHGFFLQPPEEKKVNDYSETTAANTFATQKDAMFRSGLVLAGGNHTWKGEPVVNGREDGILTAYEIARLDLSNTALVVLSACETAGGEVNGSEGVIGLQRAFKMAGVRQIMMSLWDVPDKQTAELMTLFYKNWVAGCSTREALRMAQLVMKARYPSSYYWAAFVLVE